MVWEAWKWGHETIRDDGRRAHRCGAVAGPILELPVPGQEFATDLATAVGISRVAPPAALPVHGPAHRIDIDNVQSTNRNGVLAVTLPKTEDSRERGFTVQD